MRYKCKPAFSVLQVIDKEAEDSPEDVGQEDIKAARHLVSKLGLKPPSASAPNRSDSAKSKSKNGRQATKRADSTRSKNGRSTTPEKSRQPVNGQHAENLKPRRQKPVHIDTPAFLSVQPPDAQKKALRERSCCQRKRCRYADSSCCWLIWLLKWSHPSRKSTFNTERTKAEDDSLDTYDSLLLIVAPLLEEEPLGNASLPKDGEHTSPPSFKGFLTEQQKLDELAQSNGDIMDSQDIWTPRNMGMRACSSGKPLLLAATRMTVCGLSTPTVCRLSTPVVLTREVS